MRLRTVAAGIALLVVACEARLAPEDPVLGKQACAACKMLVSVPEHAAQLVDSAGERRFFDDIGCMAEFVSDSDGSPRAIWVKDGERWVDARRTRYAGGENTPMAYGFVAKPGGPFDFDAVLRGAAEHRAGRHR